MLPSTKWRQLIEYSSSSGNKLLLEDISTWSILLKNYFRTLGKERLQNVVTAGIKSKEETVNMIAATTSTTYEYKCHSNSNGRNENKYPNLKMMSIITEPN